MGYSRNTVSSALKGKNKDQVVISVYQSTALYRYLLLWIIVTYNMDKCFSCNLLQTLKQINEAPSKNYLPYTEHVSQKGGLIMLQLSPCDL